MALVTINFESHYLKNNHNVKVKSIKSFGCCMEPSGIIPTGSGNR